MNYALIFAGGAGRRMNVRTKPKQFLKVHDKPIIIFTLENFEKHAEIDGIVIACIQDWIPELEKMLQKYRITKVKKIVAGGATGQESIYNGLCALQAIASPDSVVLVHDGVRPVIDAKLISENIKSVLQSGSAITVAPAIETITIKSENNRIEQIIDRQRCNYAKAPQSFVLGDLLNAHSHALQDGRADFVDTASLMLHYGYRLYTVEGASENLKITTQLDYQLFRAILDTLEDKQLSD